MCHAQLYVPSRRLAKLCIAEDPEFCNAGPLLLKIVGSFRQALEMAAPTQHTDTTTQKADIISYLFGSKVLDILVYLALHFQERC
jgi:hypothetical protein